MRCIQCCLLITIVNKDFHLCIGKSIMSRRCYSSYEYRKLNGEIGCQTASYQGHSVSLCFCDTYVCNGGRFTKNLVRNVLSYVNQFNDPFCGIHQIAARNNRPRLKLLPPIK